jgi:hypothetical protein
VNAVPADWSSDGKFLLISFQNPQTGSDLIALPLEGDRKLISVSQTTFEEEGGRFSPDGR